MKIRESGMPAENVWAGFFNPAQVLTTLGVNNGIRDVADFGCGYGTFTIPAAKIVKGEVYAIDVEQEMLKIIEWKKNQSNLNNVIPILRDFISEGSGLENESMDYVMLFNILHVEKPKILLKEAWRILGVNGKIGIIHWNYDPNTPRGPPMEIRPKPEQCINWAKGVGFISEQKYDLKPYHYGIVMTKVR